MLYRSDWRSSTIAHTPIASISMPILREGIPMGILTIEAGKMRASNNIGQGEPTIRSTK